jgi:hypothetical protein
MTVDELKEIQRRVKFCMRRGVSVQFREAEYLVTAMLLRYNEKDGFFYTVELTDAKRLNSTVTAGLSDIVFPAEGGGFRLANNN